MFAHPVTVADRKRGGGGAQQPQRSPTLVSADHSGCKHKPAGGDFHLCSACTQNLRDTPQIKSSTFRGVFFFCVQTCKFFQVYKVTRQHMLTACKGCVCSAKDTTQHTHLAIMATFRMYGQASFQETRSVVHATTLGYRPC